MLSYLTVTRNNRKIFDGCFIFHRFFYTQHRKELRNTRKKALEDQEKKDAGEAQAKKGDPLEFVPSVINESDKAKNNKIS